MFLFFRKNVISQSQKHILNPFNLRFYVLIEIRNDNRLS